MLACFGNVLGMLGVVLIATALFQAVWIPGVLFGVITVFIGALFHFSHLYRQKGEKMNLDYYAAVMGFVALVVIIGFVGLRRGWWPK